jgi:hypothetical protein
VPATPGLVAVMGRVCPGIGVAAGTAAGSGSGKAFMGTDDDELADELREGGDAEDQTAAIKFLQGLSPASPSTTSARRAGGARALRHRLALGAPSR